VTWWSRGLVDLALTGYLWATVQALGELAGRRVPWPVPTRALLVTAWGLHTLGLVLRAVSVGGVPVGGLHGTLSMIVWAAVLVVLWAERRYALRALPAFTLGPVALLGLAAAATPEAAVFGAEAPGRTGHALSIVLGLGALAGNFAGGLMYVLQERAIRHGRLGGLSRRLPPLGALDRFSFHTLVVGFPFLTLGIVLGTIAAARAYGLGWLWQPTPLVALATWLIYALGLWLRAGAGWGGRRGAYLALAGFAAMVTTLSVSLLLPTRHVALLGP
jgi:ABC-type transport system involved in cytochrome c biogenesis permease subunit